MLFSKVKKMIYCWGILVVYSIEEIVFKEAYCTQGRKPKYMWLGLQKQGTVDPQLSGLLELKMTVLLEYFE